MSDDADTVFPYTTATLADGRAITVHQLTAAGEDRVRSDLEVIGQPMREAFSVIDDAEQTAQRLQGLVSDYGPQLSRLVRESTGLTPDDWEQITLEDALNLKLTWLGVHLRPLAYERMIVATMAHALSRGAKSQQRSSGAATPETPET